MYEAIKNAGKIKMIEKQKEAMLLSYKNVSGNRKLKNIILFPCKPR